MQPTVMAMGKYQTSQPTEAQDRILEPLRTVLILAPAGTISQSLLTALEHEFPFVRVRQLDAPQAALTSFAEPVGLVLVDAALVGEIEIAADAFSAWHPNVVFAEILTDRNNIARADFDYSSARLVRSALPMELRLDVWLSVIQLMLRGGEYLPRGGYSGPAGTEKNSIDDLTPRELQVLELVSEGYQNKAIAVHFNVSEHTVKIHLHNIITKLGAHNRTEAAAHLHARGAAIFRQRGT